MSELESNPPSLEELMQVLIVTNMRIYDTLLSLLAEQNFEAAKKVIEYHNKFDYLGPLPFLEPDQT